MTSLPSLLLHHHRHHRHHHHRHHHHKFISVKSSTIILLFIPRKEPAEASKRDAFPSVLAMLSTDEGLLVTV